MVCLLTAAAPTQVGRDAMLNFTPLTPQSSQRISSVHHMELDRSHTTTLPTLGHIMLYAKFGSFLMTRRAHSGTLSTECLTAGECRIQSSPRAVRNRRRCAKFPCQSWCFQSSPSRVARCERIMDSPPADQSGLFWKDVYRPLEIVRDRCNRSCEHTKQFFDCATFIMRRIISKYCT